MRLQLSALINRMDGSLNGTTFQQGLSGQIARNKPRPRNPQTASQNQQRLFTSTILRRWQYLTLAQKTSWNVYAAYFQKYQKNNNKRLCSGQSVYIDINVTRLLHQLTPIDVPVYNAGRLTNTTYSVELTSGTLHLLISTSIVPQTEFIQLYCTPPVSNGILSPPNNYRLICFISSNSNNYNFTTYYQAVFNVLPTTNSHIFWKARNIDFLSGLYLPWQKGVNSVI